MCICGNYLFFGMTASLAYLGIVTALTIDNQLTVMKSDCYERLAIGQRLNPKTVYKSFEYNTLSECQTACTGEQNGCRSFSFGIGTQGNGTCELSSDLVKETADLKPIGTVAETDYDLYIKKLGCSVVIDKTPHDKPPLDDPDTALKPTDAISSNADSPYDGSKPDDEYHHPKNEYPKPPYASSYDNRHYLPPNSDEVHHVQTLVSVASGPNSYLHPIHEILVGDGPYSYGKPHKAPRPSGCCEKNKECCAPSDLPPFRPAILSHPYDDGRPFYRPKPDDYGRPPYDKVPYGRPGDSYDRPDPYDGPSGPHSRPHSPYDRPGRFHDRPDPYGGPDSPNRPYDGPDRPNDRPDRPNDRPDRPYDGPDRPYDRPDRPHDRPDSYDGPDRSHDRPNRPYDRPDRPYDGPDRPHDRPNGPYDGPDRPHDRPNRPYDRPDRPYDGPDRPHDRPNGPYDGPDRPHDRPIRPYDGPDRPHDRPDSSYDRPDPDRPSRPYDKPGRPYDGPDRPHDRPNGPYDGPDRPHDRPDRPYDGPDRPHDRPDSSYDRPDPDRPSRPYDKPGSSHNRPDSPYDRPGDLPFDTRRWDRRPDPDYDRPSKRPLGPDDGPGNGGYHYDKPRGPHDKDYDGPPRRPFRPHDPSPNSIDYDGPRPPKYGSVIPHPDDYNRRPGSDGYTGGGPFDRPPKRPFHDRPNEPDYPGYHYDAPPSKPPSDSQIYGDGRPGGDSFPGYNYDKPSRPTPGSQMFDGDKPVGGDRPAYFDEPSKPGSGPDGKPNGGSPPGTSGGEGYGDGPVKDKPNGPGGAGGADGPNGGYSYDKPGGQKVIYNKNGSIISTSIGPHGEQITSIITEIKDPCFRRVLAGKRAARRCVKRAFTCETVEQCQRECADERYFTCEGFNYRLDPTGRGKGDCELLDLPLSQLDIGRDLYPDPDYDYYERDRNAASANCKQWPSRGGGYYPPYRGSGGGYGGGGGYSGGRYDYEYNGYYADRRYDGKRPPGYKGDRGPSRYDSNLRRPGDIWAEDDDHRYRPLRPGYDYDNGPGGNRRGDFSYHHSHSQDYENSRRYYHDRERFDFQGDRGIHYLPAHFYTPLYVPDRYKSYEPYLPPKRIYPDRFDYNRNRDRFWGLDRYGWGSYGNFGNQDSNYGYKYQHHNRNRYDFDRRNYYLPARVDTPKDWGLYGGTYGNGGTHYQHSSHGNKQSYDYWGFYKYQENYNNQKHFYGDLPLSGGSGYVPSTRPSGYLPVPDPPRGGYSPQRPGGGSYLPDRPGSGGYLPERPGSGGYLPERPGSGGYLPERPGSGGYLPERPGSGSYLPDRPGGSYSPLPIKPESHFGYGGVVVSTDNFDNSILPAEPRRPPKYDFIRDECSLRSAAGFRLHKGIVKKFYAVPNIYECELLCFREKDFPCTSYAYRYTISLSAPTDNCYLSNRDYKELDYYTDLEPDRDFDIYTMNNRGKCEAPIIHGKDNSECFWRVRSGQRLAQKVVRDSLTAKSIVECQLECLRSTRFTCRAFSFRYGSPVIGGVIDNCQLTDWPYFELDPRSHFTPEPGFEVYERGSFGHGCEPDHFGIKNKHRKDGATKVDQLCYVGFGSPARLLPQASKKTVYVTTELECKAECSKSREGSLFQCMSFSYRSSGPKDVPNCQLSDILQRDLLPNVDYVYDPDYWLFAWDNYSPECVRLANEPVHGHTIGGGKEGGIDERYGWDTFHALDTWRVYSVSGWPCRRGSLCQENREAGFWFCELEGGDKNSWDYCCRPDHQCGASDGYGYQWCYVGPTKTQWRKCSDRYYPYIHNIIGKVDISKLYLPTPQKPVWRPPSRRPGGRPDRPSAIPLDAPPTPSLDEYEKIFEDEFLDPPKPGGFVQARHWPVSYLHKEMPPNSTDSDPRLMRMEKEENSKYTAIQNLISVIKNNDLKNVQYTISNNSNNADDILFVKIPLPTNFTEETKSSKRNTVQSNTSISLEPVYSDETTNIHTKRSHNTPLSVSTQFTEDKKESSYQFETDTYRSTPVYRRGFVTRANVTEGRISF